VTGTGLPTRQFACSIASKGNCRRPSLQLVQHGGRVEAAVAESTTQLVVLPQPEGAAVPPAALLKAVAHGEYGAPALRHLRCRLATRQLHLVTSRSAADFGTLTSSLVEQLTLPADWTQPCQSKIKTGTLHFLQS
jgi:hypothetical protein